MTADAIPRRGRPPSITRERIAAAGIELTLPAMTFAAVAKHLRVTQAALYKHLDGLDALRRLVAEEIFTRWQIPAPDPDGAPIEDYLLEFGLSIRALAHDHPGISGYLTRHTETTPTMINKIAAHHHDVAHAYRLPPQATRWLLSTIAFHCVALADTIYASYGTATERSDPSSTIEEDFVWGVKSLILGSLQVAGIEVDPGPGWSLHPDTD